MVFFQTLVFSSIEVKKHLINPIFRAQIPIKPNIIVVEWIQNLRAFASSLCVAILMANAGLSGIAFTSSHQRVTHEPVLLQYD